MVAVFPFESLVTIQDTVFDDGTLLIYTTFTQKHCVWTSRAKWVCDVGGTNGC